MTPAIIIEQIVNSLIWPKQNVQNALESLLLRRTILQGINIYGAAPVELSTKIPILTAQLDKGRWDRPIWEESSCEVIIYDY